MCKDHRKLIFVSFAIFTLTLGPISGFSEYSDKGDKVTHKHPQQKPYRIVDGSKTPELIPDHAAQEVFLRSLVARPDEGESGQRRIRSFAEETGLKGAEVDALLALAHNFVARTSVLDNQVKEIKDKHWPQPSESVKAQLVQLQASKRTIIAETVASLLTCLRANASVGKVHRYTTESVKRQMSAFTPPNPLTHLPHLHSKLNDNKQGIVGRLIGFIGSNSFTTIAAAPTVQLMGEGYTYSNASYDIGYGEGYTYGSTVEDYSSFGHQYNITVTSWLGSTNAGSTTYPAYPDYYSPPISTSRTVSLILGDGMPFEGFLSSSTSGEGFCPVSFNYFGQGSSGNQTQIGPTLRISSVSFLPATIARTNGSTKLRVQISSSPGVPVGTQVNVETWQNTNSGPADLSIAPLNGQNEGTAVAGTVAIIEFTIATTSTNPKASSVTYIARILSVTPPSGSAAPTQGAAEAGGISSPLTVQ